MTSEGAGAYNCAMRRAALFAMVFVACAASASAAPVVLQTGDSPVVNVVLRGGTVTLKTWSRDAVQVESADAQAHYVPAALISPRIPEQIPAWSQTVKTARGPATLPPETWVLPSLSAVAHDGVVVRGSGNATVTLPAGTSLVVARVIGKGDVVVRGYRGTFFLSARAGSIRLSDSGGTGFLQTVRGPILVEDSQFDRIRARNAIGPIFFSRCAARQIELTSVFGNIVYDDGSLTPGIARFESQGGDVAVGIGSGSAQIGGHSASGQVATAFSGRAAVRANGPDTEATIGTGGPTVTATSITGTVLLYDGSLRAHAALARRAPAVRKLVAGKHPAQIRAGTGATPRRRV